MTTATRREQFSVDPVLFVALELDGVRWKIGSTVARGQKPREKGVDPGDVDGLFEEITRAKERFGLPEAARVVSCYEAGRDGFWIHRCLRSAGIENVVVDPASLKVDRRKKSAKTDRIDLGKLLKHEMNWFDGEKKEWSVVRVPEVGDEDARHFHREMGALKGERTRHVNRIKGLFATQGVRWTGGIKDDFPERLEGIRLWDGSKVPPQLRARLVREHARLQLVGSQIKELEQQRKAALRESKDLRIEKVRSLIRLKSFGENFSWLFVMEIFGWRKFDNRKQVGSLVGLTPTPYDSGGSDREQGIDKAGNRRVRAMAVELAWCWLRHQPNSKLSKLYT